MSHLKVLKNEGTIPVHEYRGYLKPLPVVYNRPGLYFNGTTCWREGILKAHAWRDGDTTGEGTMVAVEYPVDVFKYQLESFDIPRFSDEHLEILSRANQLIPNEKIANIIEYNKREKLNRLNLLRSKLYIKNLKREYM